jgi:hypothetical protein
MTAKSLVPREPSASWPELDCAKRATVLASCVFHDEDTRLERTATHLGRRLLGQLIALCFWSWLGLDMRLLPPRTSMCELVDRRSHGRFPQTCILSFPPSRRHGDQRVGPLCTRLHPLLVASTSHCAPLPAARSLLLRGLRRDSLPFLCQHRDRVLLLPQLSF